jgi:hypothetical protein
VAQAIILATKEAQRSGDWGLKQDPISKKPSTKIRPVEWLKVKALSSSPSTARKENMKRVLFCFSVALGLELGSLHLVGKVSTT